MSVWGVLGQLLAGNQESVAEKWAAALGPDAQVMFVEHCLAANRLRAASRGVRAFKLQAEFPDVEKVWVWVCGMEGGEEGGEEIGGVCLCVRGRLSVQAGANRIDVDLCLCLNLCFVKIAHFPSLHWLRGVWGGGSGVLAQHVGQNTSTPASAHCGTP